MASRSLLLLLCACVAFAPLANAANGTNAAPAPGTSPPPTEPEGTPAEDPMEDAYAQGNCSAYLDTKPKGLDYGTGPSNVWSMMSTLFSGFDDTLMTKLEKHPFCVNATVLIVNEGCAHVLEDVEEMYQQFCNTTTMEYREMKKYQAYMNNCEKKGVSFDILDTLFSGSIDATCNGVDAFKKNNSLCYRTMDQMTNQELSGVLGQFCTPCRKAGKCSTCTSTEGCIWTMMGCATEKFLEMMTMGQNCSEIPLGQGEDAEENAAMQEEYDLCKEDEKAREAGETSEDDQMYGCRWGKAFTDFTGAKTTLTCDDYCDFTSSDALKLNATALKKAAKKSMSFIALQSTNTFMKSSIGETMHKQLYGSGGEDEKFDREADDKADQAFMSSVGFYESDMMWGTPALAGPVQTHLGNQEMHHGAGHGGHRRKLLQSPPNPCMDCLGKCDYFTKTCKSGVTETGDCASDNLSKQCSSCVSTCNDQPPQGACLTCLGTCKHYTDNKCSGPTDTGPCAGNDLLKHCGSCEKDCDSGDDDDHSDHSGHDHDDEEGDDGGWGFPPIPSPAFFAIYNFMPPATEKGKLTIKGTEIYLLLTALVEYAAGGDFDPASTPVLSMANLTAPMNITGASWVKSADTKPQKLLQVSMKYSRASPSISFSCVSNPALRDYKWGTTTYVGTESKCDWTVSGYPYKGAASSLALVMPLVTSEFSASMDLESEDDSSGTESVGAISIGYVKTVTADGASAAVTKKYAKDCGAFLPPWWNADYAKPMEQLGLKTLPCNFFSWKGSNAKTYAWDPSVKIDSGAMQKRINKQIVDQGGTAVPTKEQVDAANKNGGNIPDNLVVKPAAGSPGAATNPAPPKKSGAGALKVTFAVAAAVIAALF